MEKGQEGVETQVILLYFFHLCHPSLFRELTKSGCHNRVAPSSPTVSTRSSEPGWPADKTQRISEKKGRSRSEGKRQWGREVADSYHLHGAPGQLHNG